MSSSPSAGEASSRRERFGDYVIERELASGGMATVYEAVEVVGPAAPRRVALKRIHPHLARDPAFVNMFLDEARIAARITHPNVCRVLGYGRESGVSFLTMELLQGRPLSQLLSALAREASEGSEHVRFVATLLIEAARGLHAAHELRADDGRLLEVVHRDVSPQNLFCTFEGTLRVLDFGVASARDKLHRTETGAVKGKLGYLAPEQIAGKVDRRADVWALGVVLWEVLALKRLFRRATPSETMLAVERDPITPPSSARRGLTAALDGVVLAALERDRERRLPDALAFEKALLEALAPLGGPLPASERATWTQRLFAEGAPRSPEDVVTLAQVSPGPISESSPAEFSPAEFSPVEPTSAGERDASALASGQTDENRAATSPQPTSAESAPAARTKAARRWWALLPLALALVLSARVFLTPGVTPSPATGPSSSEASAFAREAASPTAEPAAAIEPAPIEPAPIEPAPIERIEAVDPVAGPSEGPRVERVTRAAGGDPREAATRSEEPAITTPPAASLPVDSTPGRITVPLGVAVCFDHPCRDRSVAVFGPRSLMLPGGEHRVHYIEVEGPSEGPATPLGATTVSVSAGVTTTIPRP